MTRKGEEGFTLVELLVAVTILAIVMGALAGALMIGLGTTTKTGERLASSQDQLVSSASFGSDVQSSDAINPAGTSCGPGAASLTLRWQDSAGEKTVQYSLTDPPSRQVVRSYCFGGSVTTRPLASAVASIGAKCDGGACASDVTPREVQLIYSTESGEQVRLVGQRRKT